MPICPVRPLAREDAGHRLCMGRAPQPLAREHMWPTREVQVPHFTNPGQQASLGTSSEPHPPTDSTHTNNRVFLSKGRMGDSHWPQCREGEALRPVAFPPSNNKPHKDPISLGHDLWAFHAQHHSH